MTKASSVEELVSIVTLIIPNDSEEKPIVDPDYCQEQLIIFLEHFHFDYIIENGKVIIRQLNNIEKKMYSGMFTAFGNGKIQGKRRLNEHVHIKIT